MTDTTAADQQRDNSPADHREVRHPADVTNWPAALSFTFSLLGWAFASLLVDVEGHETRESIAAAGFIAGQGLALLTGIEGMRRSDRQKGFSWAAPIGLTGALFVPILLLMGAVLG